MDFAACCTVVRIAAPALRDFVEHDYFTADAAERERVIAETAAAVKDAGTDVLVLACTHFLHMAGDLQAALGEGVHLVDSREGVVNQLERVLKINSLLSDAQAGEGVMYLTGPDPAGERYRLFAEKFGLALAGPLI
jgi:glutamate racemase